ncbi:Uncharacterized protein TCM_001941 [Theobroma cacao]|uniref:Uncharacterized protein n=1 Tax=Theobroma cacao TaxID=3641 RepID=A0A061DKY5_THECC|nr:Uncharacterized protein TCM_001941 [Theobroma cacao]
MCTSRPKDQQNLLILVWASKGPLCWPTSNGKTPNKNMGRFQIPPDIFARLALSLFLPCSNSVVWHLAPYNPKDKFFLFFYSLIFTLIFSL